MSRRTLATRPLPPRPSLEFERKQAKTLLRQLRAGDADALSRAHARHGALGRSFDARIPLADAQLVIAREYGFASWPRLVQYLGDVERQRLAHRSIQSDDREHYESSARSLIRQHLNRRPLAGRSLAASVPRFYGETVDEVFASTVSESDARLTVARQNGYPSWDVLIEAVDASRARNADPWIDENAALKLAARAINAGDLETVKGVVADHTELLRPTDEERRASRTVVASALAAEERGVPGAREITDWLASQGFDIGLTLNARLYGHMSMKTESVRFLLERGADPNGIAPNGISVLEHALIRYRNSEAVDLIARRAKPKRALWIAAGLGDVDSVGRFLGRNGKPTAAAFRHRPDFAAVGGPMSMLSAPAPDDAEILAEAFLVAMLNDRIAVLDYMIDRGFPIDYLGWEIPLVSLAAGNRRVRVVECLVRRGADLDLRGRHPDISAREMARKMFKNMPTDPGARRIVELCGAGDADQLIGEMEARPAPEPQVAPNLREALELAGDDASRRGQPDIRPENLLIGMFRVAPGLQMEVMRWAAVDLDRLRAEIGARVLPADDRIQRGRLPLDADAQEVVRAAIAIVRDRKKEIVTLLHVLRALSDAPDSFLPSLLTRCGSTVARLRERLGDNVL
ncbi:MAG: Clp protease N-terminal domain-containing protein [Gemmatimonadaceae bacterium]